jgi:uncharacterized protein (DUF1778 family)
MHTFTIRYNDDEAKRIKAAARHAGTSVNQYIRTLTLFHAAPCLLEPESPTPLASRVTYAPKGTFTPLPPRW